MNKNTSAFIYNDGKLFNHMLRSISLHQLRIHTVLTIGLYEVKNGSDEITMPFLLEFAEECSVDDQFIDWIEEHTPYKYSSKKKRIVQNNKKHWNISSAFLNPLFSSKEILQEEINKLPDIRQESDKFDFFDLGILLDQLDKELDKYHKLIDSRKRNYKISRETLPYSSDPNNVIKETKNKKRNKRKKGSKDFQIQKNSNSSSEVNELSAEKKETKIVDKMHDAIKEYLSKNPVPDSIGPLGVPQSKYRYGTYGINSMEYDAWSRWRKN